MKNLYLIIAVLLFCVSGYAQSSISIKDSTIDAFKSYLHKNTRYPAVARENNVQGTAVITIKINAGQKIDSITFARHLTVEIDSEIIQKVRSYNGIINLPKGRYTFGYEFIMQDGDDEEIKIKPINASRYNNYLFDVDIIGYATIRKATILY
jgi:predicted RND superfamily exporter protein